MNILDEYLKEKNRTQSSEEGYTSYNDMTSEEQRYFQEQKEETFDFDIEQQYKKFHKTYVKKSEVDMLNSDEIFDEDVKVVVRHAKCPVCGRELISTSPVIFNPFTKEKIAKHDCECGYKCNLDYAYPRVVFINNENKEVNAFSV